MVEPRTGGGNRPRLGLVIGLAVLGLATVVTGYAFLAPGHPTTVDVWPHLARQKVVYESLRDGFSPFYSFMFYSGYPHLRFYSPGFALLGGLLTLATRGDLVLALKPLLFGLHLLSGLAMFWYLRFRGKAMAAVLGTAVYLVVPWRAIYVAVGANYPQALVYVLLPLVFLALERVQDQPNLRDSIVLGIGLGLCVLSHGFYAAYIAFFVAVAVLLRLRHWAGARARFLGIAILAAGVVSAWFLVPFLVERAGHAFPQPSLAMTPPSLGELLNPLAEGGSYAGVYFGISSVVLILGSVAVAVRSRNRLARSGASLAGLGLALVLAFVAPRVGVLDRLGSGLPPVRFLLFAVFFGAVLVASGWNWAEQRLVRGRKVVFWVVLGVLILDCVPHSLRVGYSRERLFLSVREEMYGLVRDQDSAKVLDIYRHGDDMTDFRRFSFYPALGYVYGGLATPLGPPYHQFAPRSMLYVYPWVNAIAADLGDTLSRQLDPRTVKALCLMGVSHLITMPTLVGQAEFESYFTLKPGLDWDDRFLRQGQEPPLVLGSVRAGLVLASNRVVPLAQEEVVQTSGPCVANDWQALLDRVEVDPEANRVSLIPGVQDGEYEELATEPELQVLDTRIRHQEVELEIHASCDCFLRLAVSFYPELRVMLDRRPVEFFETKDHFIWLRCPAGRHEVRVVAPLGLLRWFALGLSLAGLGAGVVLVAVGRGRA